jgi:sialidase-1
MPSIQIIDTGLVYRNDKPHLYAKHAYFPTITSVGDELICAMDIGSAFEAVDVRSYCCRSADGGKSWSAPSLIFDPDTHAGRYSTSCRISHVDDSELVGLTCLLDRSRPDMGLANPATDGFTRTEFGLVRSRDGGNTWGPYAPMTLPVNWSAFETSAPITQLRSGRWLAPSAYWPDWEGHDPHGPASVAFLSDDLGQSWRDCVTTFSGRSNRRMYVEQRIIQLSNGRVMAECWTIDRDRKVSIHNSYTFSDTDGETFGDPLSAPIHGETCSIFALEDNQILCVYRRMDKKGLWAHLARIDADRWVPLADEPLWGANVIAHDTHQESLLAQMSTLRFGSPSQVRLGNGDVMAVFWCVEDCVSNIRWFRLRLNV